MEGREMHIPDGFLSIPVSVVSYATSAIGVGASIRSLKKNMADRMIPTMGALAAFIFAAQMFNFPVAGGTSGHLMGGFLAAVLVGPMAATIIISVVLIVQCLLFQDGGLLALGANMLNMALFATWGGWAIYRSLSALSRRGFRWAAIFIAAWSSLVIASAACAIELAASGTIAARIVMPAMIGVHAIIGIGEGLITALVVSFVERVGVQKVCSGRP